MQLHRKIPLMATKPLTYGTRRLQAGDMFEATEAHARVLRAIGKAQDRAKPARERRPPAPPKAPEPVAPKAAVGDDLDTLRDAYQEKFGVEPNKHWGAIRVRRALTED